MDCPPKTILVIDDNADIVEMLCAYIDDDNYRAVGASDGVEGILLAESIQPALILCDWSMPGMSGQEVVATLRKLPATSKLPIVIMSGASQPELGGANAFLPKPFTVGVLLSILRTHASSCEVQVQSTPAEDL
jgi:CheY-like chemotaxis protein